MKYLFHLIKLENLVKKITLLYCVSNYPSKISDFNLNNINILKKKFNCEIGFSDHSTDSRIAAAAVNAGATVIEKHICLKNVKALDSNFSINEDEISDFRYSINNSKQKLTILIFTKTFR